MIEALTPIDLGLPLLGQITPDCTSYSPRLGFTAVSNKSIGQAAKAVESDVISHVLEHQLERPVSFIDFSVREGEVTDRFGRRVKKQTLWSPDFSKSIQEVTNMEEKDGQTWEATDRLSDRVVNTSGESWHLLASPDGRKEGDDHRLMVFHNFGDGRVREYFITIRSSKTVLTKLVENISRHDLSEYQDIADVIISRERNKEEAPITLKDIFVQFTSVLDDEERGKRQSFLRELERDACLSEEELESRNAKIQQIIEEQVKEILKDGPTLSAFGLVAQSMPRWAMMVKETIGLSDNQIPTVDRNDKVYPRKGQLEKAPGEDLIADYYRMQETKKQQGDSRMGAVTALALIAQGFLADAKVFDNAMKDIIQERNPVLFKENKPIIQETEERQSSDNGHLKGNLMKPLAQTFLSIIEETNTIFKSVSTTQSTGNSLEQLEPKGKDDDNKFLSSWDKFMLKILALTDDSKNSTLKSQENKHPLSLSDLMFGNEESGVAKTDDKDKHKMSKYAGKYLEFFIMWLVMNNNGKIKRDNQEERKKNIMADFEKMLTVIWHSNIGEMIDSKRSEKRTELSKFQEFEEKIIDIGNKIVEIWKQYKEEFIEHNESFVRLFIWLDIYFRENSSRETQCFLTAFIYKEIKQILTDETYLLHFPDLKLLIADFEKILKLVYVLREVIEKLIMGYRFFPNNIFSFEKLKNIHLAKNSYGNITKKKLLPSGIIYCLKIIYQYHPLVINGLFVTQ